MAKPSSFISAFSGSKCLISFHSGGDTDAMGAAIAIRRRLKNASIVAPDRVSSSARKIADYCGEKILFPSDFQRQDGSFDFSGFSHFILLDTNSAGNAPLAQHIDFDCVIDHHSTRSDTIRAKWGVIDNKASSTCELVAGMVPNPDKFASLALLCGIISDSYYFHNASVGTFKTVSGLLAKCGLGYQQVLSFVDQPRDAASRLSMLEACRNVAIVHEKINGEDIIIATSQAASFEADAAVALIDIGADISFVGHAGKVGARISARMRNAHSGRLSMASIMSKVAPVIGGTGGGHVCAAGANGTKPEMIEYALNSAVRLAIAGLKASK
ncbi:MAG: DHH family phosphoesterase [Candidatus Micrarchaeia archaeon]